MSANGQESIRVEAGAHGCQTQGLESRQYAFRFFLDFPNGAKRNVVELPARIASRKNILFEFLLVVTYREEKLVESHLNVFVEAGMGLFLPLNKSMLN